MRHERRLRTRRGTLTVWFDPTPLHGCIAAILCWVPIVLAVRAIRRGRW